jgi:hypothetical protein
MDFGGMGVELSRLSDTASTSNKDRYGWPTITVAVIDGPYDAIGLSRILERPPLSLGDGLCTRSIGSACAHGTFIIGLLGARRDVSPPGLCPGCKLLHIPLFNDSEAGGPDISELALAIENAADANAQLINLSLALLGDCDRHEGLRAALDEAAAAGAVVLAAAGNQASGASNDLLSHPATIPVVAVDNNGQLLPSSNTSAEIARRGVSAVGSDVPGYAPGGIPTRMSGTSAATAVATGTLARVWGARPDITSADIRAAVRDLTPRHELVPPILDDERILAALDGGMGTRRSIVIRAQQRIGGANHQSTWGEPIMPTNSEIRGPSMRPATTESKNSVDVALANGPGACSCGAPDGPPVYVLGSIDPRSPDPAIDNEIEALATDLSLPSGDVTNPVWLHSVLARDEARYIARELCWILTVERQDAYILKVRDPQDYSELINGLRHPRAPVGTFATDPQVIVGAKGPDAHCGDASLPTAPG